MYISSSLNRIWWFQFAEKWKFWKLTQIEVQWKCFWIKWTLIFLNKRYRLNRESHTNIFLFFLFSEITISKCRAKPKTSLSSGWRADESPEVRRHHCWNKGRSPFFSGQDLISSWAFLHLVGKITTRKIFYQSLWLFQNNKV